MAKGSEGRIALSYQRTFSSLKNPVFRLYYGSMLSQTASMNMQMVTRSFLIYRLTGSAAILGVVAIAHALPMIILSPFGGIIADRIPKKYVLIVGLLGGALISLGVALSLTLGYLNTDRVGSWWILVAASMLQGAIMGLMMPSRQAITAEIISEKQLLNAVALNSLGQSTLRMLAPALAGFLIDSIDFEAVYYAVTGIYLMAVVFIAIMPLTGTRTISKREHSALTELRDGLRYVRHETIILLILVFALLAVVLAVPYRFMMPIFADDILKVGATGMGVLLSVSSIGAMTSSIFLASAPNRKRGTMLLVSGLISGLALVSFSFSESWYLSLVLIAFVGLAEAARITLTNSLLLYYVADDYRGRVMSIYNMEIGLMSLGIFSAGILAETVGVQWSVGGLAMVLIFLSILTLAFVPRIRRLD